METEKTITALNELIQINNDRIEGYKTAAEETEDFDLKTFFTKLKSTSAQINSELRTEVSRLGGTPTEETRTTGKFFRAWMDVKAAITGNDRKLILDSCEYGEDVAKRTYENILSNDAGNFTDAQLSMLREQHRVLTADHDKVKGMRNAESEAH
jgi:uncharacterized protein (TIGR02284 family)